jgi:hypothetical protein
VTHFVLEMHRCLGAAGINAELPSGNAPTTPSADGLRWSPSQVADWPA